MDVIVKVFPNPESTYTYEIIDEGDEYTIWRSTGPVNGKFVGGRFNFLADAMKWLAHEIVEEGAV